MKKKHGKASIATGLSAGLLLLAWLVCLPPQMFGDTPYSTVVTAKDGELLGARIADDGQWRFPPCDSLPEKFARAVVEYEDREFYSHPGVSVRSICRAMWQNITNGRVISGASTITMQTIRLHRRGSRNIGEKLIEMFMATRLEWRYTKQEILAMYASHAPFGGNVVGIGAAVWRYLGSDGNDMSWAEAATLAVLQNAPATIHLAKNRDRLLAKRNRLLKRLLDKGEITLEEYELAVEEPLIGTPHKMPWVATHFVERVHRDFHGQYVKTALDFSLQRRLESLAAHWRAELALSGINDLAAMVMDVRSGDIVAYCGNADIDARRDGMWVDIADSPRSSGSILKPVLYCAAIQDGLILENTILPDIPTDFGGFVPKNFDGAHSGVVDAKSALALSLNIPNVWLLKEYGVARFASLLQRCGLSTITKSPDKYGLSLILGGAEVSLRDVVGCYAKIARFDRNMPLNDSLAIYSMLDAMREVARPDGLDWSRSVSVQNIAWKTGTSYGARDGWAIGITPQYVVGVWVGNADGHGVADLTGARTAGPVMLDIFNLLPPCGWFEEPQGRLADVCIHSGHLASRYCAQTRKERVTPAADKSRLCPYCTEIPVSEDGKRRVADGSEPAAMKSFFVLPPVHKYFYKRSHADYEDPPAGADIDNTNLKFIYPSDGAMLTIPHVAGAETAGLTCKAAHSNPGAQLFWHLDDNYVGDTKDVHQIQVNPSAGMHKLTVYDNTGSSASIEIIIR